MCKRHVRTFVYTHTYMHMGKRKDARVDTEELVLIS